MSQAYRTTSGAVEGWTLAPGKAGAPAKPRADATVPAWVEADFARFMERQRQDAQAGKLALIVRYLRGELERAATAAAERRRQDELFAQVAELDRVPRAKREAMARRIWGQDAP